VLRRERRVLGIKSFRGDKKEALAALKARARLNDELANASVEPAQAYLAAVKAKDWPAAGRAADKLVVAGEAERAWAAEFP